MTRQQRRAAEREARKGVNPGLRAAKQIIRSAEPLTHGTPMSYSFFYSPEDSDAGVLSIVCDDHRLPLEVGRMMWDAEYLAAQDDEAAKDPTFVSDLFEQLEAVRAWVAAQPGKLVSLDAPSCIFGEGTMASDLALMAGNIAWLTSRGHLKQSEYNGTQVMTLV